MTDRQPDRHTYKPSWKPLVVTQTKVTTNDCNWIGFLVWFCDKLKQSPWLSVSLSLLFCPGLTGVVNI